MVTSRLYISPREADVMVTEIPISRLVSVANVEDPLWLSLMVMSAASVCRQRNLRDSVCRKMSKEASAAVFALDSNNNETVSTSVPELTARVNRQPHHYATRETRHRLQACLASREYLTSDMKNSGACRYRSTTQTHMFDKQEPSSAANYNKTRYIAVKRPARHASTSFTPFFST
jgi:hypothetical protein